MTVDEAIAELQGIVDRTSSSDGDALPVALEALIKIRQAARNILDESASFTDPIIGWSGWPEEYGELATACEWSDEVFRNPRKAHK